MKFVIWYQKSEALKQEHRGLLEPRSRRRKAQRIDERMKEKSFPLGKDHLTSSLVFSKKQGMRK